MLLQVSVNSEASTRSDICFEQSKAAVLLPFKPKLKDLKLLLDNLGACLLAMELVFFFFFFNRIFCMLMIQFFLFLTLVIS